MKHLRSAGLYDDNVWCDNRSDEESGIAYADIVDDPMASDCVDCLRAAAKYGALAAVRCCAVENAGHADEELMQERDAAIADATAAKRALMARGLFVCQQCRQTRTMSLQAGHQIPGDPPLVWCTDCAKGN